MWRKYPKHKPKDNGWYLCAMDVGSDILPLMVLFYDKREKKWFNITRQTVFDGYVVYKCCRAPIQENRVYTDRLCERSDVLAWKKLPKEYGRKKKGGKNNGRETK